MHRSGITMRAFVSAAAATAVVVLAACGGSGDKTVTVAAPATTASGTLGPSEVQAVPVSDTGDNPFTASVGSDREGVTPPDQGSAAAGPQAVRGSVPGLYGGTRDNGSCDAEQLVAYLEQTPDKAAAWAQVLNIRPDAIRTYVSGLTPVTLRTDTRVTNHGYANGQPTAIQSVLQAGTAVFVDRYGQPVVKCNCGNPLTPPVAYPKPVYVGPRWPGFSTAKITIIRVSITIIRIFVIYDFDTGDLFDRPAGTTGQNDTAATSGTTPSVPSGTYTGPSTTHTTTVPGYDEGENGDQQFPEETVTTPQDTYPDEGTSTEGGGVG